MLSYFRHAQRQWGYHQEYIWLITTGTIAILELVACSMMRKHRGAVRALRPQLLGTDDDDAIADGAAGRRQVFQKSRVRSQRRRKAVLGLRSVVREIGTNLRSEPLINLHVAGSNIRGHQSYISHSNGLCRTANRLAWCRSTNTHQRVRAPLPKPHVYSPNWR